MTKRAEAMKELERLEELEFEAEMAAKAAQRAADEAAVRVRIARAALAKIR